MKVFTALAIALFLPFVMGFIAAFMVPPLCWWLDRRTTKVKDKVTDRIEYLERQRLAVLDKRRAN